MEFRAAQTDWLDSVSIMVAELDHSTGKIGHIAKPVEFVMEPYIPGHCVKEPTLTLHSMAAVSLMNALWNAGVRPTDFKSAGGEIKRLEDHLSDMRKLVFK